MIILRQGRPGKLNNPGKRPHSSVEGGREEKAPCLPPALAPSWRVEKSTYWSSWAGYLSIYHSGLWWARHHLPLYDSMSGLDIVSPGWAPPTPGSMGLRWARTPPLHCSGWGRVSQTKDHLHSDHAGIRHIRHCFPQPDTISSRPWGPCTTSVKLYGAHSG